MFYKEIIENANNLASYVKKEKMYFMDEEYGIRYKLNMEKMDIHLKKIIIQSNESLKEKVTSEMRMTDDPDNSDAIKCCEDVMIFAINLLKSNIPNKLTIALFSEMNIFGYMFDRSRASYIGCYIFLKKLLDEIDFFKNSLTPADLKIWNSSTYGGKDQVPFFRGYLEGITASR